MNTNTLEKLKKNGLYILLLFIIIINMLLIFSINNQYHLNQIIFYKIALISLFISNISFILFKNYTNLVKIALSCLIFCLSFLNIYSLSILALKYMPQNHTQQKTTANFYELSKASKHRKCQYNVYFKLQNNDIVQCISKKLYEDKVNKNDNAILISYSFNFFGFIIKEIK